MARPARFVLNREALEELDRGMAAGMENLADEVIARVRAPDAPPIGVGLPNEHGWISYVDGKKVGALPASVRKPKDMRVVGKGVAVGVGFGFPGRFQEMGTINQPARPFFAPVVLQVIGDEGVVLGAMRAAMDRMLARKAK